MTRADLLLVNDIRNIFVNGTKDENPRPKYEDGTPAHTYFVNHVVSFQFVHYVLLRGKVRLKKFLQFIKSLQM